MTRTHLPGVLAMAMIVLASNILVQFQVDLQLPVIGFLTWGAFTYPLAFLITDVMNRLYGARSARFVVWAGFVVGVLCSLVGASISTEMGPLVTFRIAVGSGIAFLTAQLLDIGIFSALRGDVWWRAPLVSSIVGSSVDTVLFFAIAFSGSFSFIDPNTDVSWAAEQIPLMGMWGLAPLWVSLALADWTVKISLALLALIPFRFMTTRAA